jgi:hypothetical protein
MQSSLFQYCAQRVFKLILFAFLFVALVPTFAEAKWSECVEQFKAAQGFGASREFEGRDELEQGFLKALSRYVNENGELRKEAIKADSQGKNRKVTDSNFNNPETVRLSTVYSNKNGLELSPEIKLTRVEGQIVKLETGSVKNGFNIGVTRPVRRKVDCSMKRECLKVATKLISINSLKQNRVS